MADEWLVRRLRLADQPVAPDPRFADDLYAKLVAELGLEVPAPQRRADSGRARTKRRPGWPRILLVAALLGGSAMASIAGVGGFMNRSQTDNAGPIPAHVCDLITPGEIEAIVGFRVVLAVRPSRTAGSRSVIESCVLEQDVQMPAFTEPWTPPNVILMRFRHADLAGAVAHVGPGINDHRSIQGLGDAAALYYLSPGLEVLVLRGTDVLSVGGTISGIADAIGPADAIAIAKILLVRM